MNKSIMILGASVLQLPAIEKSIEMGLTTIVADMNPDAVGFRIPGVIKEVISTNDSNKILEAAKRYHIDGIMTLASDMPMQTVAKVSKHLGIVGISEETALKATNKAYMRDALHEAGVPIPMYFRIKTENEFNKAVCEFIDRGINCIVKPADNSGSRGVVKVTSKRDCSKAFNYAKSYSRTGEIIVEEFMEGAEVSVETLAVNGVVHVIQITDKLTTEAPYFVEMGHSQPSQLDDCIKEQISNITIAANKAIGITSGPSHTEIIVTKNGPKIVEIGARLGGDCITTHLVPLSTGVDIVKCCILIALGDEPDYKCRWNKGSAIRYIETEFGIIKDIRGVNEAKHINGVVQVSIVKEIGDTVNCIRNSLDRAGFVIAQAENAKSAIEIADRAKNSIHFIIQGDKR